MARLEQRQLPRAPGQPKRATDSLRVKQSAERRWAKKMTDKARLQRVRALSQRLQSEIDAEKKRVAESRRANRLRKAENEKKNMVTQKITNEKAIRKLSPKHRRKARIYMLHELN